MRLLLALGITVPSLSLAHDLTYLETMMAGLICIAQDANYEKTAFGTFVMTNPETRKAIAKYRDKTTETYKCLVSRRWVSRSFCNATMHINPEKNNIGELEKVRQKYQGELGKLTPLFECMERDSKDGARSKP